MIMEDSKKTTIKICTRPCGSIFFRLFRIKHFFIIDEYNNVYEFMPKYSKKTINLTEWYLKNNSGAIKSKEINVNRRLFYRIIRVQSRIAKRRKYSLLSYNCQTHVNSILAKLNKF